MKKIVFEVSVPSKTTPGDYHEVKIYDDGSAECECVGNGIYRENCWHIKRAKEMFKKSCDAVPGNHPVK